MAQATLAGTGHGVRASVGEDDAEAGKALDLLTNDLLLECVCDEKGEALWDEASIEEALELSPSALKRIVDALIRRTDFETAVEDKAKN